MIHTHVLNCSGSRGDLQPLDVLGFGRRASKWLRTRRLQAPDTCHQNKNPMTTGLANVRRHEMPDSCRLEDSALRALQRDNPLSGKKMLRVNLRKPLNVMRHIHVAFAPEY
jgi:hypothetical protein